MSCLEKMGKIKYTNPTNLCLRTIQIIEENCKYLPGTKKKQIAIQALGLVKDSKIVPEPERDKLSLFLEDIDKIIDILVSVSNSREYKSFVKRFCGIHRRSAVSKER